jgi:hypothetical protein
VQKNACRSKATKRLATLTLAAAALLQGVFASAATPDFAGLWLPVESLATPWPAELPLTPAARARLEAYNPDRNEPAGFCMPLGTPRNTLSGLSPLEVLQTDDRVYFVLQPNLLNVETRRVYLKDRPRPPPDERLPTWLGSSQGRWDGAALLVETTELEPQAILNEAGLSHSGALVVNERWHLAKDAARGELLVNDLVLTDAQSFLQPIKLRRAFVRAPDARTSEGQCSERLWIDQLWRHRLGEHADARRAAAPDAAKEQAK